MNPFAAASLTDPTALTGFVLAVGAIIAAYVVPTRLAARKDASEQETAESAKALAAFTGWEKLTSGLQAEIIRLESAVATQRAESQRQLNEQRAEHQRQLSEQRASFQQQLDAAGHRIGELQGEVETLTRLVREGRSP